MIQYVICCLASLNLWKMELRCYYYDFYVVFNYNW